MTTTLIRDDIDRLAAIVERPNPVRRRRFQCAMAGLAAAGALFVLGTATMSNADYSERYVTDQLARQKITFKAAAALTEAEREHPCVVANAGKPLTTGKQAECYANDFIGTHIVGIGKGKTYAELEEVRTGLLAKIAAAQASGDPELPNLQNQLGDLTGQREAMFKAETLRGILLTSFGFSTLGEKAAEGATAAYAGAGLVLALSLGAMVQAARTPRTVVDWP